MNNDEPDPREHVRELAALFTEKGDAVGWFEALYREAAGNTEIIPWADLEPNQFFRGWAETTGLKGDGRDALVVGCGLGDDARYLHDLGFQVTAFDISPTAIEWAKRLHDETNISFEVADLLKPPKDWLEAFEFVLEIYTIQPLPVEMRPQVIDAVAGFVAPGGRLVVVARGREDDEQPDQLPWPLSRRDLRRFEDRGLVQTGFVRTLGDDEQQRFVVAYERPLI
jgi:SAM-dependent methyltransferase